MRQAFYQAANLQTCFLSYRLQRTELNRIIDIIDTIIWLWPVDIKLSGFGENFDPSKLDFENEDREKTRESVLKVLRELAVLSNQNLTKNGKCTVSKRQIIDKDRLYGLIIRKERSKTFKLFFQTLKIKLFSMNDHENFEIRRVRFQTNGTRCLYFCPCFYESYRNEELIAHRIMKKRSQKLEEAILCCDDCITNLSLRFTNVVGIFY